MKDVAMKGDKALILNTYLDKSLIGTVVNVLSDPEMHTGILKNGVMLPMCWCNQVDIPNTFGIGIDPFCWHNTAWLLPLRGNPDSLTWTTETGRSVKA